MHIDTWVISPEDLEKWVIDEVEPAIADAFSENPTVSPGEVQCRWCRAKADCRARADYNMSLVKKDFDEPLPSPLRLTTEELDRLMLEIDGILSWAQTVKDHVLAQTLNGTLYPSWKAVYGRGRQKWRDEQAVLDFLIDAGLEQDDISELKLTSITKMKTILGKDHEVFKKFTTKMAGKPVLASVTDKRAAIDSTQSAKNDFKEGEE